MTPVALRPPVLAWMADFLAAVAAGALLTTLAISWTRRRGILDHPNARSSHDLPTPRGGGISVVAVTLVVELLTWRGGLLAGRACAALVAGGALVAAIGAWDDVRSISVRARLPVQIVAATLAVALIGPEGAQPTWAAAVLGVLAVLGLVWMTNLYNFMDGIDGIAGAQGFAAGVGGAGMLAALGSPGLALIVLAIGGACAGFLSRNWSPARIFMGDVGSGFLGFTFGAIAWAAVGAHGARGYWLFVPLLPFVIDATVTLLRRAARRAALTEAHREHLYQRSVIGGLSHRTVASSYGVAAALLAIVAIAGVSLGLRGTVALGVAALGMCGLIYAAASAWLGSRGGSTTP